MKKSNLAILILFVATSLAAGTAARADDIQPGVGRISVIQGEVSTQRGDSGDWVATTVNAPVVPGDRISTGERSRTEIQLDYANILRLGQRTEAKIADLTRTRLQIQVAQGLVNFDVLKGSEAEAEIDTPSVAIRPLAKGRYRIEVNSNSETRLTVRDGEAEVSTPQGSTTVKKGELITIEGTDSPQYQVSNEGGKDEWDDWNKDRDHTIADANSWQYANGYYTGAGDLDRYGQWVYVPGYDYVWSPYVAPGWVPYYSGRWVWEPYWGWTWVSYEPWGWAPYHYGRWFYWGTSWVWWPGPVYPAYRPVWAPAYVSFFGFGFGGGGWGFSLGFGFGGFGFGSIGWLPIGPHDPYWPWYGRYGRSFNVVNVTNIRNITNIRNFSNVGVVAPLASARQPVVSNLNSVMNNIHVQRALTTVAANRFGTGQIASSHQAVTPEMLKQGQAVVGGLPVAPTRASLSPVNRPVNSAALPAHSNPNQHFFTKTSPPAGPAPFSEQAAQVQRMIQQRPATLGAQQAAVGSGANSSPATAAQARESAGLEPGGKTQSAPSSASEVGNPASVRSQTFGHEAAGQSSSPGGTRQTPVYDNEALNRLPEPGWRRFGSQSTTAASSPQSTGSKPATASGTASQSGSAPKSGSTPAPRTDSELQSGWHRFSERPQPNANAPSGRSQSPRSAEQARPQTSNSRSGWDSSQGSKTGPASGNSAPASAGREQGSWQRFTSRPAPSERNVESYGARSGSEYPSWNRAPSRSETPAYGQGSYQRPQLEIRKPIITERAPRTSAPSSSGQSRGSSSSGSHSGGHGSR